MELKTFFEREKIEYYAALPYSECRVTKGHIMEREGFTPRSVIIYLLPYYAGRTENLSVYAASLDYHIAIGELNERLIAFLREEHPEGSYKGYGDHSPIDERHAALISGLGIAGDSGLIINEKYGTYIFIGDLVTDLEPDLFPTAKTGEIARCEGCGRCRAACPTGILRGEGSDCLSAITQRKGELGENEVEMMRKFHTVWGCDLCQTACPHNSDPVITPIEFFKKERITRLTTDAVSAMTDDEFSRRAFAWRGKNTLLRNLAYLGY